MFQQGAHHFVVECLRGSQQGRGAGIQQIVLEASAVPAPARLKHIQLEIGMNAAAHATVGSACSEGAVDFWIEAPKLLAGCGFERKGEAPVRDSVKDAVGNPGDRLRIRRISIAVVETAQRIRSLSPGFRIGRMR